MSSQASSFIGYALMERPPSAGASSLTGYALMERPSSAGVSSFVGYAVMGSPPTVNVSGFIGYAVQTRPVLFLHDTAQVEFGTWKGQVDSFEVQWLADGVPIPGAVGDTYTIPEVFPGTSLSARVSAINEFGPTVVVTDTLLVIL